MKSTTIYLFIYLKTHVSSCVHVDVMMKELLEVSSHEWNVESIIANTKQDSRDGTK